MTPCLVALRNWKADLEVDVVVERIAAPILEAHPLITKLYVLERSLYSRYEVIGKLRARRYDIAFNLHGGTTATFLAFLSGAKHTVCYRANQYSFLLDHRAPSPERIWGKNEIHCVEQQVGLLKWVGLDLERPPAGLLKPWSEAVVKVRQLLDARKIGRYVLVHPAAAFESKRWPAEHFAELLEHIYDNYGLIGVAAIAPSEVGIGRRLVTLAKTPVELFTDLSLAELLALIDEAVLVIGNDSGPAHMAAILGKPLLMVFGSSNVRVWRPWSVAPYRVVSAELPCSPCPGKICREYVSPQCILHPSLLWKAIKAVDELFAEVRIDRKSCEC